MATHVRGMSAPPAVRARGLLRAFESRVVLDRIDLDIAEGYYLLIFYTSNFIFYLILDKFYLVFMIINY